MMKTKTLILSLLISSHLGLPAVEDETKGRNPAPAAADDVDARDHEMHALILAKRFCVAMRRNHQPEKSSALLQFLDPAFLELHKIPLRNPKITTFPLFNIHNIQISQDPNTILCLVDSNDGRRHALLLRTKTEKGKLYLTPLNPPDQKSGEFSPWILKTELKDIKPTGIREKQPLEKRSASGELKHFPQNIKSREAWLGHEFLIGEVPIIPTKSVSRETLLKQVGKQVAVAGIWNPGKEWKPTDENELLSNPISEDVGTIVRNSGIEAQDLELLKPGQ